MFVSPSCGFVLDMTHFHDVEPQFPAAAAEEEDGWTEEEEAENARAVALRLSILPGSAKASVRGQKEEGGSNQSLLGSVKDGGERSDSIGAGVDMANPTAIATQAGLSSSAATV